MNVFAYGLAAAIVATAAIADPITPSTITGYSASVAVARGVPLDGSANARLERRALQFRQSSVDGEPARRTPERASRKRGYRAR